MCTSIMTIYVASTMVATPVLLQVDVRYQACAPAPWLELDGRHWIEEKVSPMYSSNVF
jgi:hypothetical protein